MAEKVTTTEQYFASVAEDKRIALEKLRKTILSIVPDATECISYGLPTFCQSPNRKLIAIGAAAKHCALYPMSGAVIESLGDELAGYSTSKGTIRFAPDKPLPVALVKKIIKARIAENAAMDEEKLATKKSVKKARSGA